MWILMLFFSVLVLVGHPEATAQDNTQPAKARIEIPVDRPPAGTTVELVAQTGTVYVFNFDSNEAELNLDGSDFVLQFADGARLLFKDLLSVSQSDEPPDFRIDGSEISTTELHEVLLQMGFSESLGPGDGQEFLESVDTKIFPGYRLAPFPELRRARKGQ